MNNKETDYYRILGVTPEADDKKIKEAFRRLALQYHPDRNQNAPDAAETMKAINEAYAVLSNPEKRRDFDALRRRYGDKAFHRFRQTHSETDIFEGSDIQAVFEEIARSFGLRGFDALFKDIQGAGRRRFLFRGPNFSGGGFFFWGAWKTGRKPLKMPAGAILNRLTRLVIKLLTGFATQGVGEDLTEPIDLSPEEAAKGGPFPFYHRRQQKKLVVKLPSGLRNGQKIRLAGMGKPGMGGACSGDLFLKVRIRKPILLRIRDLLT